ncbi:MAG: hypothetical protein JOZ02_06715 [Acidobacteria bacterium]|nr:hypothetical protein [Acidobacteriota bacterium]
MHTFEQKPRAGRQAAFADSPTFSPQHLAQSRAADTPLRPLTKGDAEGESAAADRGRPGHDFGRITLHAAAPRPPRRPKIDLLSFSPFKGLRAGAQRDKSETASADDQDQSIGSTSMSATTTGVDITATGSGLTSSTDYPDGFRWTQTIVTNANKGGPLLATPDSYTDPKPNDDTKPFYWTDAEEATHVGTFHDAPSRKARAGGTVNWDAVLSLNGVSGQSVTRFDSVTYGFSVDSSGTVTTRGPASPASVSGHMATLRGEFPGWTFT